MDDDKGLDLSLGLPCGGSSSNSKDRSCNSADERTDTDERTSKIVNDFKNFLSAGIPPTFQRIDQIKPLENSCNNISQTASGGNASSNGPELGDKCKSVLGETINHKKQETETRSSDLLDKGTKSHISITTDEGSTADDVDMADSEAEGSTSKMASHCDDGTYTPVGSGSPSLVSKEIQGKSNTGGPQFPVQPSNSLNVSYSMTIKDSPSVSASSTSSYQKSSMMQAIPSTSGEHTGPHTTIHGNVPMSFVHSPVQIPVLDKASPWGVASRPQALRFPYAGRTISTSGIRPDVHPSELSKGHTKELPTEDGSSSHSDNNAKGRANSFPSEYPSIRPGIAGDVKFGGSGSFPNLPWVSTTGPGPNGKTISGVTYKYNATQIKIVCACHGTHMSPDEFVRHATDEQPNSVTHQGLPAIPSPNPAASARS